MCRSDRSDAPTSWIGSFVKLFACTVLYGAVIGCNQKMANQPRYGPLQPSLAFEDGMASRPPVPGTVARGELQLDEAFFTGKEQGRLVAELPQQVLEGRMMGELLARGRERFGVFCSHCHGQVGGGTGGPAEYAPLVGMVVMRGFPAPPTYHQDRLRQAPLGHFFDVITNGLGRMPAHGYLVPPDDRWAITAYIRALQLSQNARRDELSPDDLRKLGRTTANAL
jgi:mono/diheme cytochrome c family protein